MIHAHHIPTLSITVLMLVLRLGAQPVVVSEYYNDNPPQEWTEILVLEDNLDLRGWIVTDNNATQTTRQGGVRFKNIPYWQHVRGGTIIGIWHRDYISNSPADFDTSMADGRIMLAKNDTRFFEPYASPDVQFPEAPMNLAQEGDIMEILDAQGNHIHGLGHRGTPGSYWLTMPEPKLNTASALNNGQTNRVFPGSMVSQYNGPHGAPLSEACAVNITRTLPNKSCSSSASNWEFWHSVRRPQWSAPRMQAMITSTNVQLSWNRALDPNPQDGVQGYLLVRDSAGQNFLPEQGRIYRDGERIGSTVVLAHLPSTASSYVDPLLLVCGVSYTYRLFVFRFGQDDEYGPYPSPQSTRGRQYNTSAYAQVTALKQVENGPSLQTNGAPTTFCEGGSVSLSISAIPSGYTAQWLRNGAVIPGATNATYQATSSGEYRLRLRRPDGCFVLSDSVIVIVYPAPTITTFPPSLIQLCEDSTVLITAPFVPEWRYQWQRNGVPVAGATNASYLASTEGSYSVVVTNEFGCIAESNPTTVQIVRVRVVSSQTAVVFPALSGCESARESILTLTNQSSIPIELSSSRESAPFFIVSPSLPVQLKGGEQVTFTLRFSPQSAGTWTDSIGVRINPCGRTMWVYVQGAKTGTSGTLSTEQALKDFGVIKRCSGTIPRTADSVVLSATANDVIVESISVSPPFRLATGFPTTFVITAGQRRSVPVEFVPTLDQSYAGDITIRYSSAQCRDSLKVPLRGILTTPYIALSAREIHFPTLDSCATLFADTTITLYNTSLSPIEIVQLPDEQIQIVQPVPSPTLTIPPRDSLSIRIRYSPSGYSPTEQRHIILFGEERCTQSEVLIVRGMRVGSFAQLSTSTIDIGRILRCRDTARLVRQVVLNVSSIPPNAAGNRIESVSSSSSWLLPLVPSGTIDDGSHPIQFVVNPLNLPLGNDTATLSIRLEPCSRVVTLRITVEVDDFKLGFEEANGSDTLRIDLGAVLVGSTSNVGVSISNQSNETVQFASLGAIPPWLHIAFSFLSTGIAPQTTSLGTLTITPSQPGDFQHTIILDVIEPCAKRLVIMVYGRGTTDSLVSSPVVLSIVIPEAHVASPGEYVRYSVECHGVSRPIALESLTIPLLFDQSLLSIEDISLSGAVTGGTINGVRTTTGYQLELKNCTITKVGTIAQFGGRVLLGRTRRTAIIPARDRIITSDTTVRIATVEPGSLELRDECNLESRLIELGQGSSIEFTDDGSTLTVIIRQIVNADATLSVYDIKGRRVLLLHHGMLERGVHAYTVLRSMLTSGAYFLVFDTDQLRQSIPILLD